MTDEHDKAAANAAISEARIQKTYRILNVTTTGLAPGQREESVLAKAIPWWPALFGSHRSIMPPVSAPSGNRRSSSVGANRSPDFTVLAVLPAVSRGGREQQEEGPGRGLDSLQLRQ
jgi:hypothetical protein